MRALTRGRSAHLAAHVIGLYLDVALRTGRWRVDADPASWRLLTGEGARGVIVVFWHEYLPAVPILWWRARRSNPDLSLHALISRHHDGRMVARIMRRWAIASIDGSSERPGKSGKGGAAAWRSLLRLLRDRRIIALTPDGPRGPRRVMQPGTAHLAAVSGAPVVPIAAVSRRERRLRSWDHMLLPLPFSGGIVVCGPPIVVARHQEQDGSLRIARALSALDRRGGAPSC